MLEFLSGVVSTGLICRLAWKTSTPIARRGTCESQLGNFWHLGNSILRLWSESLRPSRLSRATRRGPRAPWRWVWVGTSGTGRTGFTVTDFSKIHPPHRFRHVTSEGREALPSLNQRFPKATRSTARVQSGYSTATGGVYIVRIPSATRHADHHVTPMRSARSAHDSAHSIGCSVSVSSPYL